MISVVMIIKESQRIFFSIRKYFLIRLGQENNLPQYQASQEIKALIFLYSLMSSRSKASCAQAYNKHKTGRHKWDCHSSSYTGSKKVFEEIDLN